MENDKMNEKKPCPLSREEWLDLLKTYLSMKKSDYYHIFNTTLSFLILIFSSFISIIVASFKFKWFLLVVSSLAFFLLMIGLVTVVFLWMFISRNKIKNELNAIYRLIKKIINGDPVESDKIREEWDKIEKNTQI